MLHSYSRILLSNKNEWTVDSYNSMELLIHTIVWRNLKGIVLSERNYFQIVIYYMILFLWHPGRKGNRVLPRDHTGHSKHPLPKTQETMDINRWSIPKSDWLYSLQPKMEKLYAVSKKKKDQELTLAQIMSSLLSNSDLNWKKWGKPLDHSVWPKSNPLWLCSGGDK